MSIDQSEKLKLIRDSERMKTKEIADLVGINYYSYHGYETGKAKMPMEAGIKLFKHPRFRKYRDWFMFDEVNPEAGQIAPALAHNGPYETTSSRSDKKTG
ncbi:helix-turn-helix transcriptional regulator [Morganella morganii subsp. morganii]|uniref:helix-turn-helix domain-containing protein n=1 Tax=Morganella morganii TaxID=582 RepID=UPI0006624A99|nr:helix-turn-helix transcriptional regulator [Morganella morganii]MBT0437123.1 helix-turn-helix transcriptional regulator [Morganella morganii subsp. morganii]MBT0474348.1 helix-turn-helix transcriptional regulator [Morganella morganii subsp. morganii]MBT0499640.1 helix-turn-helix transcriptional regulator [Morganella morganii subsp. morganii]MCW3200445.1 helix-turn-helix domain-containing protein [Morganella morganii]PCP74989.1 XRE family transcriptional regulator [Morganella morganii]